jgi:uncharacterized membrane protein required for colicin V production
MWQTSYFFYTDVLYSNLQNIPGTVVVVQYHTLFTTVEWIHTNICNTFVTITVAFWLRFKGTSSLFRCFGSGLYTIHDKVVAVLLTPCLKTAFHFASSLPLFPSALIRHLEKNSRGL